ncbi:MAG: hypothetical protein J6U35_00170 [Clostridia bacterium]|nr:hypothetical protein [Clostridia bacterium]
MTVFFERLQQLCQEEGIDVSNIGKIVKVDNSPISKSAVSTWKNGVVPRPGTVKAIADYFHVDVAWLIGKRDEEVNPFSSIDDLMPLTSQEVEIIKVYRHASELGKMRIIAQIMKVWEQDQ